MRPRYFCVLGAAITLFAACAVTSQGNLVDLRLREADSLFDSGMYRDAIRRYEFVVESRPLSKHAHVRLALCYEAIMQPYQAIHWYENIRDNLDSKDEFVLWRLALLYTETGFLSEAAATYRELARQRPDDPIPVQMYRSLMDEMSRRLPQGPPPVRPGPLPGTMQAQLDQADAVAAQAGQEVQALAGTVIPQDPQGRAELHSRAVAATEMLNNAWGLYYNVYLSTADFSIQQKLQMIDDLRRYMGEYMSTLSTGGGP